MNNDCGNSEREALASIAFSQLRGVDASVVTAARDAGLSLHEAFHLKPRDLASAIGLSRAPEWSSGEYDDAMRKAAAQIDFCSRHHIKVVALQSDAYPRRLSQCYDAPTVLYVLGEADLNAPQMLAMVGTRRATALAANFCKTFVAEMAQSLPRLCVVSGLAYGIDSFAHSESLANSLPTVAVLAHGLGMIYPAQHRDLAMRIVSSGGALVSEYLAGVKPFKPHFLQRNRIVAGLCDATFVVESKVKGGAMSTASLAFNYSREVLALPGRHNDQMSAGCNLLIRQGKATITCSAREALDSLGWNPSSPASLAAPAQQPSLFCNLDGNRRKVYDLLSATSQPVGVDMLVSHTALTLVELASLLYDMEMEGIIMRLPNNRYVLC